MKERIAWRALTLGAAAVAAVATRKLIGAVWHRTSHSDPPSDLAGRNVSWPQAFGWSVAVAVGVGVTRVLAQRSVGAAWTKATGSSPPVAAD